MSEQTVFDLYANAPTPPITNGKSAIPVAGMPPRKGFGRPTPLPAGKPESNKRRETLDNAFTFACEYLAEVKVDVGIRAIIESAIARAQAQIDAIAPGVVPSKKEAEDWYFLIERYETLLVPPAPDVKAKVEPKIVPGKVPGRVYPSWYLRLVRYVQRRPVTALVGPAGNGKTTAAQFAGEECGYNVYEHDCTEFDTVYDLIGAMSVHGENGHFSEVWVDGKLSRWLKDPKALIILNEYDALNPKVALKFQSLFQRPNKDGSGRHLTVNDPALPNGRLKPAGPCPIVLTMNTFGTGANRQYVGRNRLDAANLDRISIIETGYENESKILQFHGFSAKVGDELESWAGKLRKRIDEQLVGAPVILSPRTLLNIAQAVELDGVGWSQALEEEFFTQIDPTYRSELR